MMARDAWVERKTSRGFRRTRRRRRLHTFSQSEERGRMAIDLGREQAWLHRFVGEWTYDSEAMPEPGKPPDRASGRENVRSLGGVWVVCEGQGDMPGGGHGSAIMSLGYDPAKRRFIGTFIGSMMPDLWIYEGT